MNLDPLAIKGSVAGAIGIPQFMPTNISRNMDTMERVTALSIFSTMPTPLPAWPLFSMLINGM